MDSAQPAALGIVLGHDRKSAQMAKPDLYLGTWELIPELSLYDFGPLPASCTYHVEARDTGVHVHMQWKLERDGPESATEFGAPADGTRHDFPAAASGAAPPVAFSLARVDERTLDSRAFLGDEEIAYARRVASEDGELLAIVQEGLRPEGGRFRNFQVYRRRPQ